jgi:FlaA1/EpsC-like NDP-sugar epimerase
VKILDLAETMIRLSGLEPQRDIAIQIVGARPGEKLSEDLFNAYERPQPTPAQKIVRAGRPALDPDWVQRIFDEISLLVLDDQAGPLARRVCELARARTPVIDPDQPLAT